MTEYETLREASTKFIEKYQSSVSDLMFHFTAGITKIGEDSHKADSDNIGKLAILALCQFESLSAISGEVKSIIEQRLPKTFEYKGLEYPIKILYQDIPTSP